MNQNNHINQIYQSTDIGLAPENAVGQIGSTDPKHVLNVGNFDGVYQYGSDFNTEWKCRQDGVAPQIGINASNPIVNAYIPKYKLTNPNTGKLENIRKFNDAHYVKNFYWVFGPENQTAPIKKRN